MKLASRAAPILLGLLVLFGAPQLSPALVTSIDVGDTVTFKFDYSTATNFPDAYTGVSYEVMLDAQALAAGILAALELTLLDELGADPFYTLTTDSSPSVPGAIIALSKQNVANADFFDEPVSYLQFHLVGLSSGLSALFDVSGTALTSPTAGVAAAVSIVTAPVPEPSTLLVVGPWAAWLGAMAWRRHRTRREA